MPDFSALPERQDAREDMEARHILLQRPQLLFAHHHQVSERQRERVTSSGQYSDASFLSQAKQAAADLGARRHHLLDEVRHGALFIEKFLLLGDAPM